jgi:hypothetical protein
MAKGGGKKRTYVRDGNGRFASTPGGGKPALKGGTLAARSSLKGSRAKLKAKDAADPSIRNALSTRSQKGAVTRGNKALRAAKVASQRTAVGRSKVGTVAKAKRSPVLKATPKVAGGRGGKAMRGGRAALPAEKPTKLAASNRPKRELAVRVARADKVDNKLKAQLKQAKASRNLKKEYETISRMQRVNRFNQTYNFADLKASRRALTPARPTAPKRTRSARTSSTVAKPKGLKPSPVNKAAAKPMKAAVQFRSRKQAAKAYKLKTNTLGNKTAASIGFNAAIERRDAFANSAPRLVSRRGKNQQITLSGGVETVRTGKMKQVGERVKNGSIRRSKAKPGPMAGSRSWKKNVERQMKSGGVVDPWLKAAYERRYGKSR